jgi:hypothetical protein
VWADGAPTDDRRWGNTLSLYMIISALAATTVGLSALMLAAAVRLGARSEESLGVPVVRERVRRDWRSS